MSDSLWVNCDRHFYYIIAVYTYSPPKCHESITALVDNNEQILPMNIACQLQYPPKISTWIGSGQTRPDSDQTGPGIKSGPVWPTLGRLGTDLEQTRVEVSHYFVSTS